MIIPSLLLRVGKEMELEMDVILGIDIGGSAVKVVGFSLDEKIMGMLQVKTHDPIISVHEAIDRFVRQYNISVADIMKIALTGVGASFISEDLYGIPVLKVDEFEAIGYGGLYLAGIEEAFVVSMGTGAAFVRAAKGEIRHIGGSAVGGGTLMGLSSIMLNKSDMDSILALANDGHIENIDLSVKDIANKVMPSLPVNFTASNFGKIEQCATKADIAVGIINMIFETIGMLAVFATHNDNIKDIILTGNLTAIPQAQKVFNALSDMFDINFITPSNAAYATAIGAVISSWQ